MHERRIFRESSGATLAEVALRVGVSKQVVSMWERGVRSPSGEMDFRWSAALRELATKAARLRAESRL